MSNEFTTLQQPTRNDSVSVTTANTIVCFARNGLLPRKVVTIRNISPNATDTITVNFGEQQTQSNTGVILRQYESVTDSSEAGYECWQGTISSKCATATGVLSVFER